MVGLVDPAQVSANSGPYSHRSHYLANQFKNANPNQIFLVPYNTGNHWILIIVKPRKETVYYTDSLSQRVNDKDCKNIVNTAIKVFSAQNSKQGCKVSIWKVLEGTPRQPTNVEYDYFVMHFMRDIATNRSLEFAQKWDKRNKNSSYTQEQIDEVRKEWAEYVSNHMSYRLSI
ncbi:unnamed protein product [Prunus armeniaca]